MSLDKPLVDDVGSEILALAARIFPICRSITGDGVRQTLREIGTHIDLDIHEVATGTPVLDWTIPREWNIRDAWIKNERGEKIVDFKRSNLHVMSYSVPVQQRMSLTELKKHIYTLPDQPDLIPYRTSYYAENWAFCMPHRQFEALPRRDLRGLRSIPASKTAISPMANICTRARPRTSSCCPPMSAIPRWRTTIARASRC